MKKFDKTYKKLMNLYSENSYANSETLPIHQGDQVMFIKNWGKNPYMSTLENTSTGERIREMIEQGKDPLIVTAIKTVRQGAYGPLGTQQASNENEYMVTVSQQYALGLYKNVVEVPMYVLKSVDNGINLPPLSDNQTRDSEQSMSEAPPIKH